MSRLQIPGEQDFGGDRWEFARHLQKMSPEAKRDFKERAEQSTFFMAREVLWMTKSDIELLDENGQPIGKEIRSGPEYGISPLSPHKLVIDCLDRPTLQKHVESPRATYKSSELTAFSVRVICKDGNVRIFYAMAKKSEAVKKSLAVRAWFQNDPVIEMIWGPKLKSRDRNSCASTGISSCVGPRWREDEWTVSMRTDHSLHDPTFQIGALDLDRTGVHCDYLITDDVVITEHVRTKTGLQKLRDYESQLQPFPVMGGTRIDVGTRKADNDPHGQKLEQPQRQYWDVVVLGCGMDLVQGENGQVELTGKSIWPFMTEEWLKRKLAAYSDDIAGFSMDYMNQCLTSGMALFNREDFQEIIWQDWMAECPAYMLTDFATSEEDQGCFNAVLIGVLDDARRFYLLDCWIHRGNPSIVSAKVVDLYAFWSQYVNFSKVTIEAVTATSAYKPGLIQAAMDRGLHLPLHSMSRSKGVTNKEARIRRLIPRFKERRFYVVRSPWKEAVWTYEDQGKKILWDPTGSSFDGGPPGQPAGELVEELARYGVWDNCDIPDAMSDIDAVDENGNWVFYGGGRPRMSRDDLPPAGRAFARVMENGRQVMVEIGRTRQAKSLLEFYGV